MGISSLVVSAAVRVAQLRSRRYRGQVFKSTHRLVCSPSFPSASTITDDGFLIALQLDIKMELLLDKRPIYFSRTLKLPVHALPIRKLVIARNPIPGCYCLFTLRFTALVDIIEGCSLLL